MTLHMKAQPKNAVIRRLWALDRPAILQHFLRLDAETRRIRFAGTVSDAGVKAYARDVLRVDTAVCGSFVDGSLRGVGELRCRYKGWLTTAEAAFSVEAPWRNAGIGDALFNRLLSIAQNRGVRTLYMICLRDNAAMKHLAAKHNARFDYLDGEVQAALDPHWPTPWSVAREVRAESHGLTHCMLTWPGPDTGQTRAAALVADQHISQPRD